ncbi:hypothetical protein BO94DRAFT_246042 [Aspergillus sclerotioniger CBS 115572]|uniref:Yeast cell wall synthesis Kre9/Knh1-like N-terminal domain-containing protein n=1 Tax=Aspergillus sclerotioniger CBS 115572 TaxID=1450535 RepID=A0A317VHZ2_9EURO|nr:hypothetical protein BO94DRAFT_246042 [Aspergillus sclerotioniger CBS 115572]PWY72502.1 hypothetical protein BO94DRAFT_246042 [Aspergillus sclerotioniger CBS 115572]
MRSMFYFALSALATLATAAQNPFNVPDGGYEFEAGSPTTLIWDPTTSGSVTLRLQWGAVFTTTTGDLIAGSIDNSGNYTWTPSASLASRSDYTVEIIDDDDTSIVNYTPRFSIAGTTGSVTTSVASSTTTSAASSTSSSSGQSTTISATTLSTATSSTSSSTSSASSSTTDSASTASASSSKTASSSSSLTASSSSSSATTTTLSTNAGMVNRVSIGMMALVLGAVALI